MTIVACAAILTAAVGLRGAVVAGDIPAAIVGAVRAVWIDADGDANVDVHCDVESRRWSCTGITEATRGLLVIVGDDRLAIAAAVRVSGATTALSAWGRVIRVMPGGASDADLHDLSLTAWKPERSRVRTQTRRFQAVRDDDVEVVGLGENLFWVQAASTSGGAVDPDAFLSLDGPVIGSVRIATARLRDEAPESPSFVMAPLASAIVGRVRDARGGDVASATVDLLEPLQSSGSDRDRLDGDTAAVARASTRTSVDGWFSFERLSGGPFLVVASAPAVGRGATWVTSLGPPVVVDLTPPTRVRGRVLRRGVPLSGARVRFVPTIEAWSASTDPEAHFTEGAISADDGTFALAIPQMSEGGIQVLAPDGTMARVTLVLPAVNDAKHDIVVGDVTIQDPRRVVVRLLEALQTRPCDILAIGPLGTLGLQTIRSSSAVDTYLMDLPESGQWALSADCGGRLETLAPTVVTIPPDAPGSIMPTFDVRFAR